MNGIPLILLIIFSVFSMNLSLQCALGIKGASQSRNCSRKSTIINLGIIFFSIIILWFIFCRIVSLVISGIFIYVLIFPVSFIVYEGIQFIFTRFILKKDIENESFIRFPGGITAAAAFICMNISNSFFETAVLSFGFTSGILIVFLIIREIRRRAALEAVPNFLRGNPLILISMGLLSLIFSAASVLILGIIAFK